MTTAHPPRFPRSPLALLRAAVPAVLLPIMLPIMLPMLALPLMLPATASAAGPAQAAGADRSAAEDRSASAQTVARATELLGATVRNPQRESLGRIEDIIIDTTAGRARYAVLSFGGVLGLGDKLFVYPLSAFAVDAQQSGLVLNVPRERLAQSPGFPKDQWPVRNDRGFWANIERALSGDGSTSSSAGGESNGGSGGSVGTIANRQNMRRASELLTMGVRGPKGGEVGDVRDLVLDLRTGQVRTLVVEFDRSFSPEERRVALPMNEIAQVTDDDLITRRNPEQLRQAPVFDAQQVPSLARPDSAQTVQRVTNAAPNVSTLPVSTPPALDGRSFQRLDRNGDGRLTRDEAKDDAAVSSIFDKVDSDHDGVITRSEMNRYRDAQSSRNATDATTQPAAQAERK